MDQALRKAKSDLVVSGVGTILFGIWIFGKILLTDLFAMGYVNRVLALDSYPPQVRRLVLVIQGVSAFLAMLFCLYVGWQAIREGTGKKKGGRVYPVLAVVMLFSDVSTGISKLSTLRDPNVNLIDPISELVLSLVRAINFALLLQAAWRVRRLSRKEGPGDAD